MKKEELLKIGLTEEQADIIVQMNEENIGKIKIEMGVRDALLKHKVKNIKTVLPLIDFDKIKNKEGYFQMRESMYGELSVIGMRGCSRLDRRYVLWRSIIFPMWKNCAPCRAAMNCGCWSRLIFGTYISRSGATRSVRTGRNWTFWGSARTTEESL